MVDEMTALTVIWLVVWIFT